MTSFIIIIVCWLCIGLIGISKCDERKPNWEMLFFAIIFVMLPFVAKIYNLL